MKNNKVLNCSVLLVFMFTIFTWVVIPQAEAASSFNDINQHWAQSQIENMAGKSIISGYPDGTFQPEKTITRAEFMTMVNKAFALTGTTAINFSDVKSNDWFAAEVAKAKAAGYVSGYQDGTMKPGQEISRQEAAVMIAKAAKLDTNTNTLAFNDASIIGSWAAGSVAAMVKANYIKGYPDNTYRPLNFIKRAEAAVILNAIITPAKPSVKDSTIYDTAGTYGPATGTQTIKGNLTIKISGITVQNMIIEGDLIVDKAVAEGNATLKNVTVKGNTYIYGGGTNSIYFIDSQTGKTYILKDDGPVRIVVSGTSEINQLIVQSSAKIEESDLTGAGIDNIIVDKDVNGKIEIDLSGADIASLEVNSKGVTIVTDSSTTIDTLVANSSVEVTGTGTIENATINANGVTFETAPENQEVATGVSEPAITPGTTTGGGGGGGGGGGTPTLTATNAKLMAGETVIVGVVSGNTITFTVNNAVNYSNASVVMSASGHVRIKDDSGNIIRNWTLFDEGPLSGTTAMKNLFGVSAKSGAELKANSPLTVELSLDGGLTVAKIYTVIVN